MLTLLFLVAFSSLYKHSNILILIDFLTHPYLLFAHPSQSLFFSAMLSSLHPVYVEECSRLFPFLYYEHSTMLIFIISTLPYIYLLLSELPRNYIYINQYFFCFAMCYYIFLKFNNSEDYLSFNGNCWSSYSRVFLNYSSCRSLKSDTALSPSFLWSSIFLSQNLLKC